MILEKILVNDGTSMDDKFNTLTTEQQIELLNEIETKTNEFKEKKLVAETKIKSLQEGKEKILEELKTKYGDNSRGKEDNMYNSIEEAEAKIAELNGEIVQALTEFVEAQTD